MYFDWVALLIYQKLCIQYSLIFNLYFHAGEMDGLLRLQWASLFNGMERWNKTVEWNDGMERWNGTMEWNGMTTPTERALTTYTH